MPVTLYYDESDGNGVVFGPYRAVYETEAEALAQAAEDLAGGRPAAEIVAGLPPDEEPEVPNGDFREGARVMLARHRKEARTVVTPGQIKAAAQKLLDERAAVIEAEGNAVLARAQALRESLS